MRKSWRYNFTVILIAAVLAVGMLTGCGRRGGEIEVYYMNVAGTSLLSDGYTPEESSPEEEVRELIRKLTEVPDTDKYVSVVPAGLKVDHISIDSHKLVLDFNAEYKKLSPSNEALLRAAFVKTLVQLDEVWSVSFTVAGQPLTDASGSLVGPMTPDSFMAFGDQEASMEHRMLTLFYASKDGQHLVKETRDAYYNSNISAEKLVVEYLMEAPQTDGSLSPIPANTDILSVNVDSGICYVNLNSNFLTSMDNVSQQVTIYAIVDSLCELDEVDKVQVSVEGETSNIFNGAKLSTIYEPDYSLVSSKSSN